MKSERLVPMNMLRAEREVIPRERPCGWWRGDRKLSPHEIHLLSMLVDGHNLKTAAAALSVSRATVAWHMHNIYEKLQVHSKSEAVGKALRAGLIR